MEWGLLMNEIYLLSKLDVSGFSMAKDFQIGKFADFEQFKIDSHYANFGQVRIDPNCSSLLTLGRSVIYWIWEDVGLRKTTTRHRIWPKSFSMIQWAVIKNWVSQLINRLQGFNLLLLSITHFADLCSKIKYAWWE